MSSAAITVVVPGFDIAPYADEALASLRAQTRRDWTAVLVDDASTDGTSEVFAAAAAADRRFRVVRHASRRGLGAARNTGLDLADTPLVGFLDGDDRMRPDALAVLAGALEDSGSEVAVGAYVRLRPDTAGGYTAGAVQPWVAASTAPTRRGTTLAEHPEVSGNIVAWSKLSRTDLWTRTGLRFPEGRLYEDQVVAQRMYAAARGIDTVPDVVVEWRERAEGTSITQRTEAVEVLHEYLDALRAGVDVLRDAGAGAAVRARVRLILTMDVPPLVAIAARHPDPGYRDALATFVDDIRSLSPADAPSVPDLRR